MNTSNPAAEPSGSAVEWLASRYSKIDAYLYANPLGEGWCCNLGVRGAGIYRSATASTQAEAAKLVAEIVATELGWTSGDVQPSTT